MSDAYRLGLDVARRTRAISRDEVKPAKEAIGIGYVASFADSRAAVRKGDSSAPATAGFRVPPGFALVVGDLVLYYEQGAYRLILQVLSRAQVPSELGDLTISGSLALTGILSPPALTASVNDYAPDGWESNSVIRLDQSGGTWSITGLLALPDGTGRELHNVSAGDLTLPDEAAGSAEANRILGPGGTDYVVPPNGAVFARYDGTSSRWRLVGRP